MLSKWSYNRSGAIAVGCIGFALGFLFAVVVLAGQEFMYNACSSSSRWSTLPDKGSVFVNDILVCTPIPTILGVLVGGRPWRRKHTYDGF